MLITNLLAFVVAVAPVGLEARGARVLGVLPFVVIDLAFFLANSIKIVDGGWFPLAFGLVVFTLLTTWKRGRELLHEKLAAGCASQLTPFIESLAARRLDARARHRRLHDRPAPKACRAPCCTASSTTRCCTSAW